MNNINNDKNLVASNLFWRFADRWGSQLISILIGVILARILEPAAYGIVTITNASISIFSVFSDCGLSEALIQKKDTDNLDYSTALVANVSLCVLVYMAIFVASPYIADFYNNANLIAIIRVSSITVLISGFKNIQHAYVAKNLMFKNYFFASLFGTIGAGVVGIYCALNGYGVWSLIISNLFDVFVDTVIAWLLVKWWPKIAFSKERFRLLFGYGSKMLINSFVARVYSKIYQLVIGKVYSSDDLAYYDKGDSLTDKIVTNIDYTISSVMFPFLSSKQQDIKTLKSVAKRTLKTNFYILTPLFMGLAAISENAITIIYTDKWLAAVPFVKVFCIIRLFSAINSINGIAIKAIGRSDIFLKQQTIKRIVSLIILFATVRYSPMIMAYGLLINGFISQLIDSFPSKKMFDYGFIEQLSDIIPTVIIGIIMAIIVKIVGFMSMNIYLQTLLQIAVGATIYISVSIIFKNETFLYLTDFLKKRIRKKQTINHI